MCVIQQEDNHPQRAAVLRWVGHLKVATTSHQAYRTVLLNVPWLSEVEGVPLKAFRNPHMVGGELVIMSQKLGVEQDRIRLQYSLLNPII